VSWRGAQLRAQAGHQWRVLLEGLDRALGLLEVVHDAAAHQLDIVAESLELHRAASDDRFLEASRRDPAYLRGENADRQRDPAAQTPCRPDDEQQREAGVDDQLAVQAGTRVFDDPGDVVQPCVDGFAEASGLRAHRCEQRFVDLRLDAVRLAVHLHGGDDRVGDLHAPGEDVGLQLVHAPQQLGLVLQQAAQPADEPQLLDALDGVPLQEARVMGEGVAADLSDLAVEAAQQAFGHEGGPVQVALLALLLGEAVTEGQRQACIDHHECGQQGQQGEDSPPQRHPPGGPPGHVSDSPLTPDSPGPDPRSSVATREWRSSGATWPQHDFGIWALALSSRQDLGTCHGASAELWQQHAERLCGLSAS
jgi:hypothetical protein